MITSGVGGGYALEYSAPDRVRGVIAALGRTEDVKFSPNNSRLAVTSFLKNQITVFEICIAASEGVTKISVMDAVEISSSYLRQPHGVDFIDDGKIIVANRKGDATIFELPAGGGDGKCHELVPLEVIRASEALNSPGNVAITRKGKNLYEALICNNFANKLTRHIIDLNQKCSITTEEILVKKWLDFPDGVSLGKDWIAVSNHNRHSVMLYEYTDSLNEYSDPDGILRGIHYPHGLRFTSDGRFILVADAGAPYVHIYRKNQGWRGVRSPLKSLRALTDDDFLRGQETIHSGGPKGIDIDNSMKIFVTTCEVQPLAFFDLAGIIEKISAPQRDNSHLPESDDDNCQREIEVKCELDIQHNLEQQIARIMSSRSWRITAPGRYVSSLLRRLGKLADPRPSTSE